MVLWTTEASFEGQTRDSWVITAPSTVDLKIRERDRIQFRTPDGRVIETYVNAVELARSAEGTELAIRLPSGFSKEDVPAGTEIWLVQQ